MGIDSECQLFRDILSCLKVKIDRSVYNRRKRKLFFAIEFIRNEFSSKFTKFENYFVDDSMSLEVVILSKIPEVKFVKKIFIVLLTLVSVQVRICVIMDTKFMQFVLLNSNLIIVLF